MTSKTQGDPKALWPMFECRIAERHPGEWHEDRKNSELSDSRCPAALVTASHFQLKAVVFRSRGVLATASDLEVLRLTRVQCARNERRVLIHKLAVLEQIGLDVD